MKKKNKCFFFDRDGVLNQDKGYISNIKDIKIFPKVGEALRYCNKNKYLVIIITNQSGIGRKLITKSQLNKIHDYIKKKINNKKAFIDDIFYCPFHPIYGKGRFKKKSIDRKPGPGMIFKAKKKWNIDLKSSYMIGDKISDKIAANTAGVKFFFKSKKINLFMQIKQILSKNKAY